MSDMDDDGDEDWGAQRQRAHELEQLKETLTKLGQADAAKQIKIPTTKGESKSEPARRLFPQA
eukprot:12770325-Alexandrium_andersonii.AAC.1